ncbi:hypothetical protein [Mesorhizobium sp. 8]|uniref:hypothetical protein n=1 Tax=Mesorhizobium sp. 8 TaxID=2584466 RepID=UPI001FEF0D96|nr:hypothetical protein [Mesorhizobium sp. 8]
MNHVLIEDGVVVQSDRTDNPPEGFMKAPGWVAPGCLYDGNEFAAPTVSAPIPHRVSANQFGKQLAALGILDQVQTWVGQQDASTQWSFNRSATFVRTDPMMQAGFAALGFTTEQIDAFFTAAASL